jgi:hypothetical protein
MNKRRHQRLYLKLPIRFVVEQPDSEDPEVGEGMLKNISYGGILFQAEPPLPVEAGQVREFSFYLVPENQKQCDLTQLRAQGLVLRIESPDPNSSAYGVAVKFLSALKMKDVTITMTISPRHRIGPLPKPVLEADEARKPPARQKRQGPR